jgi:cation efflux system protein involved in nickel and cobalt tolerance
MLSSLIKWSIAQRWLVVLSAIVITIAIFRTIIQMPLDVFPAFAPPQVEIQTEAPGLAPEEVESLVTLPIESSINGTPGISAVRSASAAGISAVRVVFNWGTDIYQARQLVTERLQSATSKLPQGVDPPQIAPISSPIGTVLTYGFTSTTTSLMEVRRIVDWQVTNRLLAVPGVTQVIVYGGDVRQYQVLVEPAKLIAFNVSLENVSAAVAASNVSAPGGYSITPDREQLIRGIGRIEDIEDLRQSVITARNGTPVKITDVAEVKIGAGVKRGDASVNGQKAVVIVVNKQPQADTKAVTKAIEAAIKELQVGLPADVKITPTFRQETYLDSSIENVRQANLIIGFALASLVMAAVIVPSFGRIFLPEFQEQSLVNTLLLYPGSSLEATNSAASVVERKLKGNPNIRSIQMRSGRAAGDADAAGVNLTHLDVELSDKGMEDRQWAGGIPSIGATTNLRSGRLDGARG